MNQETILKACKSADNDMKKFGEEHGFPVIFVLETMENELGEIAENKFKFTFFTKNQRHLAVDFAKKRNGEFGIFNPKNSFKDELLQQPIVDAELSSFCKNHHCTKRSPKCATCPYTAMSSKEKRIANGVNP